jgi:hypothetical protein
MAARAVQGRMRWEQRAMKIVQSVATVGASRERRCQRARAV